MPAPRKEEARGECLGISKSWEQSNYLTPLELATDLSGGHPPTLEHVICNDNARGLTPREGSKDVPIWLPPLLERGKLEA